MKFAPATWGIPVVQSTLDRNALFPFPEVTQRVQNLETGNTERWDGFAWITDVPTSINVRSKGARGDDTTDDSQAFVDTFTAAAGAGVLEVYVPDGRYRLRTGFTVPGNITLRGQSKAGTILRYDPTADGTCCTFSSGTDEAVNCGIRELSFYSADTTHTKIALDLVDVSTCTVENIDISGAGTGIASFWSGGTGSIGVRTRGREATIVNGLKSVADMPIYIGQNPNTDPTTGEDMDHWHWSNCYLVAKGHYVITCADGIGINNTTWDGYQAWVGGTGGFYINDTRVSPQVASRNITFRNVRGEQCTDLNGLWWNMTFTQPVQVVTLDNCLGAATAGGIKINGFLQVVLTGDTMASPTGKPSLALSNPGPGAGVFMAGCYWQPGSTFTTSGLTRIGAFSNSTSTTAGPNTATYVDTVGATSLLVSLLSSLNSPSVESLRLQATASGDGLQAWGNAAGSGASIRGVNFDATAFAPLGYFATTHDMEIYDGTVVSGQPHTVPAHRIDTSGRTMAFFAHVVQTAAITYSASMTPNALAGNIQTITATNGTAFTINGPTNAPTGASSTPIGQRLRIRIKNTSGGALGTATWDALYKLGAAWTQPANGFSRAIEFDYDGSHWVEASRTAADVAN